MKQIGIMLAGCRIEYLVIGGAAQQCGVLEKGDILTQVNGKKVFPQHTST